MFEILMILGYRFLQQVVTFQPKPVTDERDLAQMVMVGYRFLFKGYRLQPKPVTGISVCLL